MAETAPSDLSLIDQAAQLHQSQTATPPAPIVVPAEMEKTRIRDLIAGKVNVPDPADLGRRPEPVATLGVQPPSHPSDPPEVEAAPAGEPFDPYSEAGVQPAPATAPAASTADADAEFERTFLSEPKPAAATASVADDVEAMRRQLAEKDGVIVEAAREFQRDPLGSMRQINVTPQRLIEQLRAAGYLTPDAAAPTNVPADMPEDADPRLRALVAENAALKKTLPQLQQGLGSVVRHLAERDRRDEEVSRRAQRQLVMSQSEAHVAKLVQRMPTLRTGDGKLNREGELLKRLAIERLGNKIPEGADPAAALKIAESVLAEEARSAGIKPKAERAAAALDPARRPPVPITRGATAPRVGPGQAAARAGKFDDQEWRQAEMLRWFTESTAPEA